MNCHPTHDTGDSFIETSLNTIKQHRMLQFKILTVILQPRERGNDRLVVLHTLAILVISLCTSPIVIFLIQLFQALHQTTRAASVLATGHEDTPSRYLLATGGLDRGGQVAHLSEGRGAELIAEAAGFPDGFVAGLQWCLCGAEGGGRS